MQAADLVKRHGDRLTFRCPGCGETHSVNVGAGSPRWTWNGDLLCPTFEPSILARSGHYASHFQAGVDECWCTYNLEHPDEPSTFECYICHSFVTDGKIRFLGDCTHDLAGQTVPLPSWEEK